MFAEATPLTLNIDSTAAAIITPGLLALSAAVTAVARWAYRILADYIKLQREAADKERERNQKKDDQLVALVRETATAVTAAQTSTEENTKRLMEIWGELQDDGRQRAAHR